MHKLLRIEAIAQCHLCSRHVCNVVLCSSSVCSDVYRDRVEAMELPRSIHIAKRQIVATTTPIVVRSRSMCIEKCGMVV